MKETELSQKIIDLEKELKLEKNKNILLQQKFDSLGIQGKAKLYYALNKNMSDIADLLDGINFQNINLENKSDATMERVKMLWASVKPVAETVNVLEASTKLSGNESDDTKSKNVLEFAESRK